MVVLMLFLPLLTSMQEEEFPPFEQMMEEMERAFEEFSPLIGGEEDRLSEKPGAEPKMEKKDDPGKEKEPEKPVAKKTEALKKFGIEPEDLPQEERASPQKKVREKRSAQRGAPEEKTFTLEKNLMILSAVVLIGALILMSRRHA